MTVAYASDAIENQSDQEIKGLDATAIKAVIRVFKAWRVSLPHASKLAGVSERTWSRMKDEAWSGSLSDDQRTRASAIVGIYKGLHLYFDDDLADKWVKMPNIGPVFHGVAPIDYISQGGIPALIDTRNYIDGIRGGM